MKVRAAIVTWIDRAFPALLCAFGFVEIALGEPTGPLWALVLMNILITLPLYVRDRWPWAVLIVVYGTIFGAGLVGVDQYNYLAEVIAGLTAVYTLGYRRRLPESLAGAVLACATLLYSVQSTGDLGSVVWVLLLVGAATSAGIVLRSRHHLIEQLRSTTEELERSRAVAATAAVAQERARVARELHDVVAHAVSIMVVQAGAGEKLVGVDDERTRQSLRAIGDSGRQALVELRRLLFVLRSDDEAAALAPQPGLGELDALVAGFRRTGLDVRVRREGSPSPLDPGTDLAAYRIVQEALTNVIKHADAHVVDIVLRHEPGALELQISDDGTATGIPFLVRGAGNGIAGMRERAASCGGDLEALQREDGGFSVRAHLPVAVTS